MLGCLLLAANAAATARPDTVRRAVPALAPARAAAPPAQALRPALGAHPEPGRKAQPVSPQEFVNPLKRRRMASPGLPGGGVDYAF
jgi:hypothetical protein